MQSTLCEVSELTTTSAFVEGRIRLHPGASDEQEMTLPALIEAKRARKASRPLPMGFPPKAVD